MSPERRWAGRAIRKQRRELAAAIRAVDWKQVGVMVDTIAAAFMDLARAASEAVVAMVELLLPALLDLQAWAAEHERKVFRAETLVNQDC